MHGGWAGTYLPSSLPPLIVSRVHCFSSVLLACTWRLQISCNHKHLAFILGQAKMKLLLWLNAKIEVYLFEVSKIMCCALCKGMGFLWMCGSILYSRTLRMIGAACVRHYYQHCKSTTTSVTLPILRLFRCHWSLVM